MTLRPYQKAAFEAAIDWMKRCVEPCVLELATGSGKSHIVTAIAEWVNSTSGKRVLCLAPSAELVSQNHEKCLATGSPASIYSASAGQKSLTHDVVFGTPKTVLNNLHKFGDFAAVVIDEAHGITPMIQAIIGDLKTKNPRLRVVGLTATPYRTGTGYIYGYDTDGRALSEQETRDPYFNTCVYRIQTGELIDMGFLTPAHADPNHAASYDTSGLEVGRMGKFDKRSVEQAFEGHGRKTAGIVADIVEHSQGRQGVMIFAATIQHAEEVCASLPPGWFALVTGSTPKGERRQITADFKALKIKYLVNVAVLTTGFDAPHVDVVAILRATESPGLLQQIIGRGLRLSDGKRDCLVLDYAENIERHGLQDDLFTPEIKTANPSGDGGSVMAECPLCSYVNDFAARPDMGVTTSPDGTQTTEDGLLINRNGYLLTLEGELLDNGDGPLPAHLGRRCRGQTIIANLGMSERCDYRWTCKECAECGHQNDIAARYCEDCKSELIDPNEKLALEFQRIKADPYTASTDEVRSWEVREWHSQAGNRTLRVDYVTDYASFSVWHNPESHSSRARRDWVELSKAVFGGRVAPDIDTFLQHAHKATPPSTVTAIKDRASKFYRVLAHNKPADEAPNENT